MGGGNSGCTGILLYDTDKEGVKAVFGHYNEQEELLFEKGELDDIKKIMDEIEKPYKNKNDHAKRTLVLLFLAMLTTVIFMFIFAPFVIALGIFVFCVIAFFPLLIIIFANRNEFNNETLHMRFRRFHGCEHAILNYRNKHNGAIPNLEEIKKTSIFQNECGTAYS